MIQASLIHRYLNIFLAVSMLGLTGCKNGNLFGGLHDPGDSSDVRSLNSDAQAAYRSRDYTRALELYNRALAQDPNNSIALYGAASAATASAGFDLATLLKQVISQTSSSVSSAGDLISQSRVSGGVSAQGNVLDDIDVDKLDSVIDLVICRITKLSAGAADGTIPPDDLDMLVNGGILYLLRALVRANAHDFFVLDKTDGEYTITSDITANICDGTDLVGNFQTAAEQKAYLVQIAKDVAGGYVLYKKALDVSPGSSTIAHIKEDLEAATNQLMAASAEVPQQCVDTFLAGGIDISNFPSYNGPFTPPSGC